MRFVILAVVALALGACKPTADGPSAASLPKKQSRLSKNRARGAAAPIPGQSAVPVVAARTVDSDAPYVLKGGHMVRGTDLLLFLPCGDKRDYFLVAPPAVLARLRQHYRFSVRRPYAPVYVDVESRLVNDTITSGDILFDRIADVREFDTSSIGQPKCARPSNGSIMETLRRYEPNL